MTGKCDDGRRMPEKAKIIYPPPQWGGQNDKFYDKKSCFDIQSQVKVR